MMIIYGVTVMLHSFLHSLKYENLVELFVRIECLCCTLIVKTVKHYVSDVMNVAYCQVKIYDEY